MFKKSLAVFLLLACLSLFGGIANAQAATGKTGIAFGLNGIADWSTQHPFLDVMKTGRPWIGHLPNQWGGVEFEDMMADGVFDDTGWPQRIPEGVTRLESLVLTDQPPEAHHLSGRYVLTYDGQGDLTVTGRARVIKREPGLRIFSYAPGPGAVGVAIDATDPADPIRNIRIVPEIHMDAFKAGAVFNPDWLDRLEGVAQLRFMDWMFTNGSPIKTWEEMPKETDFSYVWRGVPLPVMIDLANLIGADPWFNIPHLAEDDLVRRFAELVRADLDPSRIAYVEYSNEVWNFLFEQARWSGDQAEALWGASDDGWMQYYGLRAASVMAIWTDVFGTDAPRRLRRVVTVHTGWPELEQAILVGARAQEELGFKPVDMFDAYAVTGYFGYELGEPEKLEDALENAAAQAEADGKARGLARVALREYISQNRFNGMDDLAAERVRNGSLKEMTDTLWPYHAGVAARYGLQLVMYEGGTHAAVQWEAVDNERLVDFLIAFNYSEQMADLYRDALDAWASLTDSPFNAFVDVAAPSKWGSWGALRHLNDDNPRWRVLRSMDAVTSEN
ncbi:hypothetical protein [Marivita sp.]|uniref:hypothetical protein n=1 Tax=Marivita sp. TaxID=2003365 RepID=UPI00262B1444|nr:hypothetical protein [Marivita sp.]